MASRVFFLSFDCFACFLFLFFDWVKVISFVLGFDWLSKDIKWSYDLRSYERNFCNCVEKPQIFRTSTGFEPVTSRFRCEALTNWAMKPLTLGAGHLWVLMVPWGMNQWWNGIWNESYMNCGYEIKWSYDLRNYERNFCNCVEKPQNFGTSTGFEPVTSRFRCDALINWAMQPLTLISYPQFIYD